MGDEAEPVDANLEARRLFGQLLDEPTAPPLDRSRGLVLAWRVTEAARAWIDYLACNAAALTESELWTLGILAEQLQTGANAMAKALESSN